VLASGTSGVADYERRALDGRITVNSSSI